MGKDVIQILDLIKVYSDRTVVDIPNLTINLGSIVSVMGNNGAGKTTLFRLILDLVLADRGSVSIKGQDVRRNDQWKKILASYLDESYLINYLTPEEYFYFIGKLQGFSRERIDEKLIFYASFFNDEILGIFVIFPRETNKK
jgi:ABC-2 type transport system ATP-binding protein